MKRETKQSVVFIIGAICIGLGTAFIWWPLGLITTGVIFCSCAVLARVAEEVGKP